MSKLPTLFLKSALSVIILWLSTVASSAHEGRPVYIELTQTSQLTYTLQWKTPPVMASGHEPSIRLLGDSCSLSGGKEIHSLTGRNYYKCSDPRDRLGISVTYPADNPALSTLLLFKKQDGVQIQKLFAPNVSTLAVQSASSFIDVAVSYINSGVIHILLGYDHLLFVLCLLFLAHDFRRILITVTGFTIAHSITLALAVFNLITVPILFIEALIALSIVVLAAEIARGNRDTLGWKHPVILACGFGLLHGFGFASVLADFGLPPTMKVTALAFFNIGVEIGQVAFIIACLALTRLALNMIPVIRNQAAPIAKIIILAIGTLSAYWFVERGVSLLS